MDLIEKAAQKLQNLEDGKSSEESEEKLQSKSSQQPSQKVEAQKPTTIDKFDQIEELELATPAKNISQGKGSDVQRKNDNPLNERQQDRKPLSDSISDEIDKPYLRINVDVEKIRELGMVTPDTSRSQIKEEYRHIKRPLLMNVAGKGTLKSKYSNLIMVTSSNPQEGKTFSSINLAMSIAAERDKTVLLVDCDVLKPSLNHFFNLDQPKGLTDYLNDRATLNEIIVRTDVPTFRIIPAGQPHHLSNELLASDKMGALMNELSTRYPDRIVILDSPPLLATTEAAILASHVGQILVVVEADQTKHEELQLALDKLSANRDLAIGLVLNKSRRHMESNYYGYGSGYGSS